MKLLSLVCSGETVVNQATTRKDDTDAHSADIPITAELTPAKQLNCNTSDS